jgi:hypothetical protein
MYCTPLYWNTGRNRVPLDYLPLQAFLPTSLYFLTFSAETPTILPTFVLVKRSIGMFCNSQILPVQTFLFVCFLAKGQSPICMPRAKENATQTQKRDLGGSLNSFVIIAFVRSKSQPHNTVVQKYLESQTDIVCWEKALVCQSCWENLLWCGSSTVSMWHCKRPDISFPSGWKLGSTIASYVWYVMTGTVESILWWKVNLGNEIFCSVS